MASRRVSSLDPFFQSPGVPTSGKVFVYFVPSSARSARLLQSLTRSRGTKWVEFRSYRSPFLGHESFVRIKRRGRSESQRPAESLSKKKFSAALCGTPRPQRLLLPRNQKRWGPIGLAGLSGLHMRSPSTEPDRAHRAVAHLGQRVGQLQSTARRPARHFSPRPANGPIVVIGGENSTTILGHL